MNKVIFYILYTDKKVLFYDRHYDSIPIFNLGYVAFYRKIFNTCVFLVDPKR